MDKLETLYIKIDKLNTNVKKLNNKVKSVNNQMSLEDMANIVIQANHMLLLLKTINKEVQEINEKDD